ncbi:hypothetical protein V1358_17180 [Pseudoalteromonas sp. YIC-656]|uniref:hypothetical protein n=1 Tax=Pseudoalteromonas pernae TaxID=3118054 RepID=UPI003242DEFD
MKKYLVPASLALLSTTLTTPAVAFEGMNEQALKACSFIENDFRRLLCYDNVVAGKPIDAAREKPSKSNAPATAAAVGTSAASVANQNAKSKEEFGLEHKIKAEEEAKDLIAGVTKISEAPYGELIITLDNGQVWRQIGTESFNLSKNDEVVISRAMFNSFLLKKAGTNKTIRVKRTN